MEDEHDHGALLRYTTILYSFLFCIAYPGVPGGRSALDSILLLDHRWKSTPLDGGSRVVVIHKIFKPHHFAISDSPCLGPDGALDFCLEIS